jgi:anti-sigma factor RsiW
MCEHSAKLIAWIDREMSDQESTEMERHLENCAECRIRAAKYEEMSQSFEAYCATTMAVRRHQKPVYWVPLLSAAAAVVLCVAIGFRLIRPRPEAPTIAFRPVVAPPAATVKRPPILPLTVGRRPAVRKHTGQHAPAQSPRLVPAEPMIQIAIPADSLLPPGALPEGVDFAADVSFAPDGSAQQMRLRPQLIRFERRPQP